MSQEWMIDVLTDLKKFAQANGLMALAEQLDDSLVVAVTELKLNNQEPVLSRGQTNPDNILHRAIASGENV